MTDLKEEGKRLLDKYGLAPDTCDVRGCGGDTVDTVELRPLDPIDHDSMLLALCEHHREWAENRNDLADTVAERLREVRKDIGQEHFEDIQRLATPQDGQLREDILQGTAEGQIPLDDAHTTGGGES